jgi:hypothetical protein
MHEELMLDLQVRAAQLAQKLRRIPNAQWSDSGQATYIKKEILRTPPPFGTQ